MMETFAVFTLCILLLYTETVSGNIVTTPINGNARLTCPTTECEWKQKPIGISDSLNFIYIDSKITRPYQPGGRHRVVANAETGTCDLLILNVTESDAGKYICMTKTAGERTTFHIELVVLLDAAPTCRPNITLTNVLIENDCNLEPDSIEFSCTAAYRGNVTPPMQLKFTSIGVLNEVTVHNWHQSATNYTTVTWTGKASWRMRDGQFVCEVGTISDDVRPSCFSPKVSIMYFYKTMKIFPENCNPVPDSVTCIANTSEQCSYSWQTTTHNDSPLEKSMDVFGPTVNLKNQILRGHSISCRAECIIRDIVCAAESMRIECPLNMDVTPNTKTFWIISFIAVVVFILLSVVFLCWRKKQNGRRLSTDLSANVSLSLTGGNEDTQPQSLTNLIVNH